MFNFDIVLELGLELISMGRGLIREVFDRGHE